jgi:hypothetical protein
MRVLPTRKFAAVGLTPGAIIGRNIADHHLAAGRAMRLSFSH